MPCAGRITKRATKKAARQEERKHNRPEHQRQKIAESECSGHSTAVPAGAPPCSSSGLTGTGSPHPDPVLLVLAGLAVIENGVLVNKYGSGAWTFLHTTQFSQ